MNEATNAAERVVVLARRFMQLGLRPDDLDDYDEFEMVVLALCDALDAAEAQMRSGS